MGFTPTHLARVRQLIERFENGLSAVQLAALSALSEWNARHAFAPVLELDSAKRETRSPGLGHQVCLELAADYARRARSAADVKTLPVAVSDISERLMRRVGDFTQPVEGSLAEVEATEANRNPQDLAENRATDKRMIEADAFTPEALLAMVRPRSAQPASVAAPSMPPPPPPQAQVSYYVAVNGQTQGPFGLAELGALRRGGQLDTATLVYPAVGGTAWLPAGGEAALGLLFAPEPTPPPGSVFPPPPPNARPQ